MKKIVIAVLLSSVFITSFSQIKLGIKVDPQFAWFRPTSDSIQADGITMGLNMGLILDFYFADNYAFATGISISSIGGSLYYEGHNDLVAKDKIYDLEPGQTINYRFRYVEVPLMLKMKTREFGRMAFWAQVGVVPQVCIQARATDNASSDIDKVDVNKSISLFNMGYTIAVGPSFSLGSNTALITGLSYVNGFWDVTNKKTDSDKVLAHYLSLRIGIQF